MRRRKNAEEAEVDPPVMQRVEIMKAESGLRVLLSTSDNLLDLLMSASLLSARRSVRPKNWGGFGSGMYALWVSVRPQV